MFHIYFPLGKALVSNISSVKRCPLWTSLFSWNQQLFVYLHKIERFFLHGYVRISLTKFFLEEVLWVKRLCSLLIFMVCLCAFMPVALMYDTYYEGNWIVPVANMGDWEVTSPFGWRTHPVYGDQRFHDGVDIAASASDFFGGNAVATASGEVVFAGWKGGYGLTVIIRHPHPRFPGGIYALYAHAYQLLVSEGEFVNQGQPITIIESETGEWTGTGNGAHLHFEIREDWTDDWSQLDPALFVAGIPLGSGSSPDVNAPSSGTGYQKEHVDVMGEFKRIYFEFKYEMLQGFRNIFETFAKAIVAALHNIHSIIRKLIIILFMIDLALGSMFQVFKEGWGDSSFAGYFVYKFFFYGIMLLLIDKFPDLANHFVKDWFIASAGKAMSTTDAEVIRIVSDPMMIIEKGLNIIQPILNEAFSFSWNIGEAVLSTLAPSLADTFFPGSGIISFLLLMLGIIIYLILLFFIGVMIALAYLQFYFFILFAFTTLIFAGTLETRKTRLANRGLTGVFAGAINLMFYCIFTLLLSNCLVFIAEQAKVSDVMVTREVDGVPITNANDLMNRIRLAESGNPPNYISDARSSDTSWETTPEFYGAYHIHVSEWDSMAKEAYENGAPLVYSEEGGVYPTPESHFKWTPNNQDALVLWKLENDYKKMGDWKRVAQEFFNHCGPHSMSFEDYWKKVSKSPTDNAKKSVPAGTKNLSIVLQLNICLLVFVYMGVRISNLIASLFKGNGFELLSSQQDSH